MQNNTHSNVGESARAVPPLHTPEWYHAYRTRKVCVVATTYPNPGTTKLGEIDLALAEIIAGDQYSHAELSGVGDGGWYVRCHGHYVAMIGTIHGQPAILHKRPDGSRELQGLAVTWEPLQTA